jgi:hypothetical protein
MTTMASTAMTAAEATPVAAVVADRVVVRVGVSAPDAGAGVVGPKGEQAPAGTIGLTLGLVGERFGAGDRVAFLSNFSCHSPA